MDHPPVLTDLRRVVGYHPTDDAGAPNEPWLVAIVLQFAEADLLVGANLDNDEAVLRVEERAELQYWPPEDASPRDATADPRWSVLIGADSP